MKYSEIKDYIDSLDHLTKIEVKIELDEYAGYQVVKTKETYVYEDEDSADEKVDAVRQSLGFAGVDKTYKAGKMNKAGDVVKPETWNVVVKLNHQESINQGKALIREARFSETLIHKNDVAAKWNI